MTEIYEQMRKVALSVMSTRIETQGMGILVQRGMATWLEVINDFQHLPRKKAATHGPEVLVPENNVHAGLINILTEIALKTMKELHP